MTAPIPIELLLAGRDLTEPQLSPDGKLVAFVQRWRGGSAIVLVPPEGGPERLLTVGPDPAPGRGLGGGCFAWHPGSTGVVYTAVDGELWWQPLTGGPEPLTTLGRETRRPIVSPDGGFVVCAVDEAEIWRVPLDGGDVTAPVRLDDGGDAFCFDPVVAPGADVVAWLGWSPPAMPWDAAHVVSLDVASGAIDRRRPPDAAVQQPGFAPDGVPTCVHDGSGWLNVHIGDQPVVAEPFEHAGPTWGMGQRSYALSPDGFRVAFCRNESGFGRLCIADRRTGAVTAVGKGGHGQLSWRGDDLVALRTGAVTPTQIVRYDTSDLSVKPPRTVLAVGPAAGWDGITLPEPELVESQPDAEQDDGPPLHARRYAAGSGRMLVWVHGGPTDQWQADFRPRISYWWSRGWDVLVVDPRGTTGHGRAYQRALNGRWGRLDVDDTARLVRWAHRAGWAAPATTVVIGGSSGGLTVLGLLADHPDLVAAGVASYPVSDLTALADADHRFEAHYTDTLVGSSSFDDLSPLHRAGRITAPLLLFHGTDDPVVPFAQSAAVAEAIRAGGGSVDFVVYDGEGHGFREPDNVRDEYDRTERFLADSVMQWQ